MFISILNEELKGGVVIMSAIMRVALILVIIGALNWGLIGFFRFDLVASLFGGQDAFLSRVIYALVGISGLASLGILFQPMVEDDREVVRNRPRPLHAETEFGEEADFSKEKEIAQQKPRPNKNNNMTNKNKANKKK